MRAAVLAAVVVAVSGFSSLAVHAGDIEAGKAKTATCVGCHGADGNSVNPEWPSLAGQHAKYLEKQLREYKSGVRQNAIMAGMAAILSDEDIVNVAAYYESLTPKGAPVAAEPDVLQKGQDIYRGGITEAKVAACIACHSPNGQGNGPAGWPVLAGQHAQYTVTQLKYFRDETRANDAGRMMRNVSKRMSDAEMEAVAAYIAALK